LFTGKTEFVPRVRITIPQRELVTAVNSVRIAQKSESP
jgi:hypothetical protein